MPETINYADVLADLMRRREDLDKAIEAIRPLAALASLDGPIPTGGGGGGGSNVTTKKEAPRELQSDSFFGMKAPEATRAYLGMVKRPQTISEIVEALKAGGFMTQAKDRYNNLYTALLRMQERGEAIKVGENTWGLTEWYPGRAKARGNKKDVPKEVGDGPVENDGTDTKTAA